MSVVQIDPHLEGEEPVMLESHERFNPEISWPLVSASYNFSMPELAEMIASQYNGNGDAIRDLIPRYIDALIRADYLWGRPIMDSLLGLDRPQAVKAIHLSIEERLENCIGVDGPAVYETIKGFVGDSDPLLRVKHNQLAAAVYYWAWFNHSVESAYRHVQACKEAIDKAVFAYELRFPIKGFTDLVVEAFKPVYGLEPSTRIHHVSRPFQ